MMKSEESLDKKIKRYCVKNEDPRRNVGVGSLRVERRRLRFGHIQRMDKDRIPQKK